MNKKTYYIFYIILIILGLINIYLLLTIKEIILFEKMSLVIGILIFTILINNKQEVKE